MSNITSQCQWYENLYAALADLVGDNSLANNQHWQKRAISGGCIHDSAIFYLTDKHAHAGQAYFVKQNSADKFSSLAHEADGLLALGAADCIATAKPLALGVNAQDDTAFLILDVINEAPKKPDFWADFARSFATLHTTTNANYFGWQHDDKTNRIAKRNTPNEDWITFFAHSRLQPQLSLAKPVLGGALYAKGEKLIAKLDQLIEPPPHPQLMHGDLWSGNYMVGSDGKAVLIDPAVYYGHGEADLAMTHLFGGFAEEFYAAYQEINPLSTNYNQHAEIYNLFHLLNHLNLFGQSYLASVKSIIERYC